MTPNQSAAEQGLAKAQFNLGIMLANGYGVQLDYVLAHAWLNIAIANGLEQAGGAREELEGLMTREQIADARARARVCMSSGY